VNVPTWNYIAVHVYGKAKLVEGDQLREALNRLINKHEAVAQKPVSMDSMPEDFLNKEIKGVAGLEISIERIEGCMEIESKQGR
jgi:transcriptional regulator